MTTTTLEYPIEEAVVLAKLALENTDGVESYHVRADVVGDSNAAIFAQFSPGYAAAPAAIDRPNPALTVSLSTREDGRTDVRVTPADDREGRSDAANDQYEASVLVALSDLEGMEVDPEDPPEPIGHPRRSSEVQDPGDGGTDWGKVLLVVLAGMIIVFLFAI